MYSSIAQLACLQFDVQLPPEIVPPKIMTKGIPAPDNRTRRFGVP
jgi:hypothetical protein